METSLSRRAWLVATAAAALTQKLRAAAQSVPVGLELYSVRDHLKSDVAGTVGKVAAMGYQCVEFYAPYHDWTPSFAKDVRKQMDDLGIRCYSTHNDRKALIADGLDKSIELNKILGTRYIVMAHPGNISTLDDWRAIADTLNHANETMKSAGLHAGYHNHDLEWKLVDGQMPLELLAKHTDASIMLQLDVGTCVATGNDPVAWIDQNPGRIRSLHLKDWSPDAQYRVLFGEGVCPWAKIFQAAESSGGVEYYLIEQEGSQYGEFETAEKCLANYRKMRAG